MTIDIANAIHFDLDLFATTNDEEWESMEETCVLRNALCRVTDKQNKPKFKHKRHRPENLKRASRRLRKLNAVIANPDAPSARECLDPTTADYQLWEASTMKEVAGVVRQALEAIPVDDLTREERRDIMRSKLVCRVKRNEYGAIEKRKVRLVACGNTSVKGVHHNTTHAPTASPVSIRTLVAIATKLRRVIRSFDLEQCYLQAPIQQPCLLKAGARLLMYPPRELILKDRWGRPCVFQVTSNLYGLASGGADSFTHFDAHMINEQLLAASKGDPCLYAKRAADFKFHSDDKEDTQERAADFKFHSDDKEDTQDTGKKPKSSGTFLFHSLYTDDGVYFGDKKSEKLFEDTLSSKFKVRVNSVCQFILGCRLEQTLWDDKNQTERVLGPGTVNQNKLSQRAFAVEIVRLVPEKEWLHTYDQTDCLATGAPQTKEGELPDFNARTKIKDGAPRQATPLRVATSKLLDESYCAAVLQLQQDDTLTEPLFLEDSKHWLGGGIGPPDGDVNRDELPAGDPKRLRPTTGEEREELENLKILYPYRTLVAKINYLARMTRPDLSHGVGVLSRHLSNPGLQAYRGLQELCRYILHTLDRGIIFSENSPLTVPRFYVDANFPFGRARGGYVALFMGGSIDWQSKLAATTASSTAESEIQAAFMGFCRALATKKDLDLLGITEEGAPIDVEEDSNAALLNLTGEVLNGGSLKWIANKVLKSIEWVRANRIRVHKCDTTVMWADGLTKQLARKQHNTFVRYTMGCATFHGQPVLQDLASNAI